MTFAVWVLGIAGAAFIAWIAYSLALRLMDSIRARWTN